MRGMSLCKAVRQRLHQEKMKQTPRVVSRGFYIENIAFFQSLCYITNNKKKRRAL